MWRGCGRGFRPEEEHYPRWELGGLSVWSGVPASAKLGPSRVHRELPPRWASLGGWGRVLARPPLLSPHPLMLLHICSPSLQSGMDGRVLQVSHAQQEFCPPLLGDL